MSNVLKGTLILGGAALGIAAAHVAGPLVLVTSAIGGGTAYAVNALAAAGLSCSIASGYALGKVAGQTGTALIIQGLDEASSQLVRKVQQQVEA